MKTATLIIASLCLAAVYAMPTTDDLVEEHFLETIAAKDEEVSSASPEELFLETGASATVPPAGSAATVPAAAASPAAGEYGYGPVPPAGSAATVPAAAASPAATLPPAGSAATVPAAAASPAAT